MQKDILKLKNRLDRLYKKFKRETDTGELWSIMLDIVECELLLERECNK